MRNTAFHIPRLLLEHPLLLPALALVVGICLGEAFYAPLVGQSMTLLLLALGFGASAVFMLRKRALEMAALGTLITAFCLLGAGLLTGQSVVRALRQKPCVSMWKLKVDASQDLS